MTNGYQQFFKKAQEVASKDGAPFPKAKVRFSLGPTQKDQFIKSESEPPRKKSTANNREKVLVGALRKRMKQQEKKSNKKIPARLIFISALGVLASAGGLWKFDLLEKYAKRVEVSVMGYANAEETADAPKNKNAKSDTTAAAAGTAKKEDANGVASATSAQESAAKKEFSEEEINHFAKLNERKRELDSREEELNRMEQELAKQKSEMEKRLKELETTRRQISSVLEEKVQADDKKVDSLVQVYSNMKPQQAAKVFESMDEDLAIEILGRMKKKPAAEILNLVKAEKAQVLSEKYAGYKRP